MRFVVVRRFDEKSASGNVDYIDDFSAASDTIQLSQSIFSALATGTLSASAFHVGTSAADASDHIIYDQARGYIYYDADGNGGAAGVMFGRVDAGTVLTNADFSVIASAQAAQAAQESPMAKSGGADSFAMDAMHVPLFTDVGHVDHLIG